MQYALRMHPTHFVEANGDKKERLVADLGRTASKVSGTDANTLSPDANYGSVQADYIDEVAESLVAYIKSYGADEPP